MGNSEWLLVHTLQLGLSQKYILRIEEREFQTFSVSFGAVLYVPHLKAQFNIMANTLIHCCCSLELDKEINGTLM